jgi:hypothetical protein
MAADDDGQQRSSERRGVDEASEALREAERQRLLETIDEFKRELEASRESQAATHRLQAAVDECKRALEVPEHRRTASWEAKYLSHLDELDRAAQFLLELTKPHLDIPPRSESE